MSAIIAILKGVAETAKVPAEWNVQNELHLDDVVIMVTFCNGAVRLEQGNAHNAESVIRLTNRRLCDYIDGTIDFMTVWRELAEPSPTDRTCIQKGSGAKFYLLIDAFMQHYRRDGRFQLDFDLYKAGLKQAGTAVISGTAVSKLIGS